MWDWKNMYGPSVLSGIGMYWGLDLIQGWWSTEPVWQVKDCRLGQGRDGVVVSQGTAASQELCVEEEWVEKLEREVHSNESCLGGSVRWRCFMSWRSDGIWTWGGAVVQVTVQACKRVFHSVSDLNTFLRSVILSCILQDAEYLKHFGTLIKSPLCTQQSTHFNMS